MTSLVTGQTLHGGTWSNIGFCDGHVEFVDIRLTVPTADRANWQSYYPLTPWPDGDTYHWWALLGND